VSGQFHALGKSLWYPLDESLGGSKSRSESDGEEINASLPRIETWLSCPSHYTDRVIADTNLVVHISYLMALIFQKFVSRDKDSLSCSSVYNHFTSIHILLLLLLLKLSTNNIIANIRHAWLYECAVCAMRKKLKLSSEDGDSGRKKSKEAMVAPMVGSGGVCVWRESGVRRSGLCWCVWQESGFSRREDVFTFKFL
jgi:hypothetical protein